MLIFKILKVFRIFCGSHFCEYESCSILQNWLSQIIAKNNTLQKLSSLKWTNLAHLTNQILIKNFFFRPIKIFYIFLRKLICLHQFGRIYNLVCSKNSETYPKDELLLLDEKRFYAPTLPITLHPPPKKTIV